MFVEVLNGYNQDGITSDLIDQAIRKSVCPATADALGKRVPSFRILQDSLHCSLDLRCEFVPKSFTLKVVIGDGLDKFSFGRIEKIDPHDLCLLIFSNTWLAGVALILP